MSAKSILVLICFFSSIWAYSQVNVDTTTRIKYNLENQKYTVDFYVDGEMVDHYIMSYPNGQLIETLIKSADGCCDSIIKYHPNGMISLVGKLFSWEKQYDSLWGHDVIDFNYEARMYYEDGQIASHQYRTDSLTDIVIYDTNEVPYFQQTILGDTIVHDIKYLKLDDNWHEFELVHNNVSILYIKVNEATGMVEDFKWLEDAEINNLNMTPEVIKFDGFYYPNNIELFDLEISIK